MKLFILFCCFAMAAVSAAANTDSDTARVTTPLGKVVGSLMESRLGKKIYAFRGLRYAEAPVGQQRFKQAVPALAWKGVFNATEEGPRCPQPWGELRSEDCLRLNVYSTKLPRNAEKIKRPVIIYFHAGGYYGNSAQSIVHGPQYFLDQNIVLVTANYRLASLGFMSTGDSLLPGNLGLKDQVEALRWIKKNIASFGGDPDSVTISGYSAGGWSVSLHMLSPMSKGLFHRVIAMSGAATFQEPLPHDQKNLAKKQAELLGCPSDTTRAILVCLNKKTAEEIANTYGEFFYRDGDPIALWLPVVEPEVAGVERFLTAQPTDLIRQGKINDVPLIVGITKDEFGGAVVPMIEQARAGNKSEFDYWNENWYTIAPIAFLYERNTRRSKRISDDFKQFYLKGKPIGLDNYKGLAQLYADGVIGFPAHRFVNLMAQSCRSPVYYYKFSYQGRYSHNTWTDTKKPYGVTHHDDLMYLFYISFFPYFGKNAPEVSMVERYTGMWANFAKTGQPIPSNNDKFTNVTWTPFTVANQMYLEINTDLVMKTNLYTDRYNQWERLFPLGPVPHFQTQTKE